MTRLQRTLDELTEARAHVQALEAQAKYLRGFKRLKCKNCGKRSEVRHCTYLLHHGYIPPRGCTGGDYYVIDAEGWRCPKCEHDHRLYSREDDTWLKELRRSFAGEDNIYRG